MKKIIAIIIAIVIVLSLGATCFAAKDINYEDYYNEIRTSYMIKNGLYPVKSGNRYIITISKDVEYKFSESAMNLCVEAYLNKSDKLNYNYCFGCRTSGSFYYSPLTREYKDVKYFGFNSSGFTTLASTQEAYYVDGRMCMGSVDQISPCYECVALYVRNNGNVDSVSYNDQTK